MIPLSDISGLPPEAADLLTAAGIRSVPQLARQDVVHLHSRLEVLAWQRGRSAMTPSREQLEQWIALAGMLTPPAEAEGLSVDDIPEAVVVAPAAASPAWMPPSMRAERDATGGSRAEPDAEAGRQQSAAAENSRRRVDPNHFATMDAYNEGRIGVQPLSRESLNAAASDAEDPEEEANAPRRTQRIRSTGEKLSRWVRRGVVHPRPFHTWLGAVVSVVWRLALVTGIAAFIWLVTSSAQPSAHKTEVISGSIVLFVLGCMQLHFAGRSRCRICSCNLFYSKNCHKNRKAHLLPGIGYVASAALHLLIFGWFRCMYCGTAIRLHPSKDKR
jgi:hypothetical protein